jgi:hypothetical protein
VWEPWWNRENGLWVCEPVSNKLFLLHRIVQRKRTRPGGLNWAGSCDNGACVAWLPSGRVGFAWISENLGNMDSAMSNGHEKCGMSHWQTWTWHLLEDCPAHIETLNKINN